MTRRPVPLLLVLLLVVTGLAPGPARAQSQSEAALAALAGPLYDQLATLKGMPSPGAPPPIQVKSRAEMRRFIEQELDRLYPPARLESERKGMVAWGLIPPDYDLRRLYVDLMEEQIAAYYDPRGKVMVVGDWLPPEQQEVALMHELVHALQDRQVALDTFMTPNSGQGDQLLARQALIEGEAVALSLELVLKAQGTDLASLPDLSSVRSAVETGSVGPTISAAPRFLRDLLLFPYVDGLGFVYQFRKAQPWSAMTALYRDPPRSTTQIMNPAQRLTQRQDPVPVALPDLGTLRPGATVVSEDELGEFGLRSVLSRQLGDQAARAAAGWRGDRYRIWADADGRLAIAYLLVMADERSAADFASGYGRALERRYPSLSGKAATGPAVGLASWRDGNRAFIVERRGVQVLVLEQMPAADVDGVRAAIWKSRPGPATP
ncbi:MAG TPA: ImmA/IrrE family metallo-endopeptidase [Candidatus Methylomirabilis sp.]|nr:ImmA/IrrE family metallo-endopeptidase [Candidatus Methylomirabilis sp.]